MKLPSHSSPAVYQSEKTRLAPPSPGTLLALLLCANCSFAQSPPGLTLQISGGNARLNVSATSNTTWTALFNTNTPPLSNAWLPLASFTMSNSPRAVLDNTGPAIGNRFYRVISLQPPTNIITSNMIWLGPGAFAMGSPSNEVDRFFDEIRHTVSLTRGFYIGKFLVSQGDYLSVMGNNPSYFNGVQGGTDYGTDLSRPVERVNWYSAVSYCSQLTQREQTAGRLPVNWAYRLPTEAEWEFACRAGTTNQFSYGNDPGYSNLVNYAWYSVNSGGFAHPVAQKIANPWNLFDFHGDVYEWCLDWYDTYPTGLVVNPQGPATGTEKVFRGGAWLYIAKYCRAAGRYSLDSTLNSNTLGFRIVAAPQ